MAAPPPMDRGAGWAVLVAAGLAVACCAGPLLLVLLATTGLSAVAVRSGSFLVAGAAVAAGLVVAGLAWRRRRACAGPGLPAASSPHKQSQARDDGAGERAHAARARELNDRPSR